MEGRLIDPPARSADTGAHYANVARAVQTANHRESLMRAFSASVPHTRARVESSTRTHVYTRARARANGKRQGKRNGERKRGEKNRRARTHPRSE